LPNWSANEVNISRSLSGPLTARRLLNCNKDSFQPEPTFALRKNDDHTPTPAQGLQVIGKTNIDSEWYCLLKVQSLPA
jgi:hypothetical protein